MMRLTWKGVKFEWNDLCEEAFQELKKRFTSSPIPIVPRGDRGIQCIVMPQRTDFDAVQEGDGL